MDNMPADVVAQLRQSRQRLDAEIEQFSDEELLRKGSAWGEWNTEVVSLLGEWSIKDLMAHIAAWDEWLKRAVDARIRTGTLPPEMRTEASDPDTFNARAAERWRGLDAPAARAAFHAAFADLLHYLESLNPADLYRPVPRPDGRTTSPASSVSAICAHNDEHCAQLGQVLAMIRQS